MGEHDMPRTTEEFHNYVADGTLSWADETLSARSYRAWRDGNTAQNAAFRALLS